jgi:hypothetical protein
MTPLTPRKKAPVEVPLADVVALFKEHFKRGPWPNKDHCYRLAIAINAVKHAKPQEAKYGDKTFARRLAIFNAMQELTREQLKKARKESLGLRLTPELVPSAFTNLAMLTQITHLLVLAIGLPVHRKRVPAKGRLRSRSSVGSTLVTRWQPEARILRARSIPSLASRRESL